MHALSKMLLMILICACLSVEILASASSSSVTQDIAPSIATQPSQRISAPQVVEIPFSDFEQCRANLVSILKADEKLELRVLDFYINIKKAHERGEKSKYIGEGVSKTDLEYFIKNGISAVRNNCASGDQIRKIVKALTPVTLPDFFHQILESRAKYLLERFQKLKEVERLHTLSYISDFGKFIPTLPQCVKNLSPCDQFLAQTAIDRFASLNLMLDVMYSILDLSKLPSRTQEILKHQPILMAFLKGDSEHHPVQDLSVRDGVLYGNFIIDQVTATLEKAFPGSIIKGRPARKFLEKQRKKASRETARESRLMDEEEMHELDFKEEKERAQEYRIKREAKLAQKTQTKYLRAPSAQQPFMTDMVVHVMPEKYSPPPLPKEKVKTRGVPDPTKAATFAVPVAQVSAAARPVSIYLDDDDSSFFFKSSLKTFKDLEALARNTGIEIYDQTKSSHRTLLYGGIKGFTFKPHGDDDTFCPKAITDIQEYFERCHIIPSRDCTKDLQTIMDSIFGKKFPIDIVLKYLNSRVTLSTVDLGEVF